MSQHVRTDGSVMKYFNFNNSDWKKKKQFLSDVEEEDTSFNQFVSIFDGKNTHHEQTFFLLNIFFVF